MVLLLNIGNTHTCIAEARDGKITSSRNISTSKITNEIFRPDVPIAAACVVPEVKELLKELDIYWITYESAVNVDFSKVDTATLGADRIANLIAMESNYNLPALCIDFGTAITFELLGKDKSFLGGAISPGRALLRKSMHDYTAQLPLVRLDEPMPDDIGTATIDQMALGIDLGAVGMVKELINRMNKTINGEMKILATGGDAEFFIKNIPKIEYAGDDFTLTGILRAWETHSKKKKKYVEYKTKLNYRRL